MRSASPLNRGSDRRRIGSLQGTYLGVYPAKLCEYWTEATTPITTLKNTTGERCGSVT